MPAPYKPDDKSRKQILLMAGIGLTHDQIAKIMEISDETLRRHYKQELATAKTMLNTQVAGNLFNIATSKDHKNAVTAAIFWMKTRAKWKETLDLSNEDGSLKPEPVQVAVMNALAKIHDA
jgi:Spy/CpxP family protein refolding chaperone